MANIGSYFFGLDFKNDKKSPDSRLLKGEIQYLTKRQQIVCLQRVVMFAVCVYPI